MVQLSTHYPKKMSLTTAGICSTSFRCNGRLFHSLGPAAANALLLKVLYACRHACVWLCRQWSTLWSGRWAQRTPCFSAFRLVSMTRRWSAISRSGSVIFLLTNCFKSTTRLRRSPLLWTDSLPRGHWLRMTAQVRHRIIIQLLAQQPQVSSSSSL